MYTVQVFNIYTSSTLSYVEIMGEEFFKYGFSKYLLVRTKVFLSPKEIIAPLEEQ